MAVVERNTLEDFNKYLQGQAEARSYLTLLKVMKSSVVANKDEKPAEAKERGKTIEQQYPEYFEKEPRGITRDEALEKIKEIEKRPSVGDVKDIDYKKFLQNYKAVKELFIKPNSGRRPVVGRDEYDMSSKLFEPEKKAEGVQPEKSKEQEVHQGDILGTITQSSPIKKQEEPEQPKSEKGIKPKKVKKIKEQQAPTPEPTQKPIREQEAEQMETLDISDIGKIEKKKPVKKKKGGNIPEEKIPEEKMPEEKMPEEKKSTKWFKSLKKKDFFRKHF